jgi:hypothetical protein
MVEECWSREDMITKERYWRANLADFKYTERRTQAKQQAKTC